MFRILIVDDDQDTRTLMVDVLEPDYCVLAVSFPQQALDACRRQRFDLAVVDVRLAGTSGLDLVPRELELTVLGQQPAEETGPTATLTPTFTLPVDPAVTPTLTPTPALPTPTVTPTPTLTPAPAPALSLLKTAVPTAAEPGQVVTFTLVARNDGTAGARDLLVRDRLPKGLVYLPDSAPNAKYDLATATLTWPLSDLEPGQAITLSLAANIEAEPGQTVTNTATLSSEAAESSVAATAAVYVSQPGFVTPDGGLFHSADGRVEIQFPAGAVAQDVAVSHHPLSPIDLAPPYGQHIFYRFELEANLTADLATPVTEFAKPLTVTLTYTDSQVEGLMEDRLQILSWNEDKATWEPLSTTVDVESNRLTAQLRHFSVYGGGGEDDVFFQPRIDAALVSQFTGDASFSYELEVPAGAGGLHVPLSLRYDSGIPNGMRCSDCLPGAHDNSDTGWVGVGWTLELGKVENGSLTLDGLSGKMQHLDTHISQDPLSWQCDWDNPSHCSYGKWTTQRWRLEDEKFAWVQFCRFDSCTDAACCGSQGNCPSAAANRVKGLGDWEVWAKDGTKYTFGSQAYNPTTYTGSRLHTTPNDWSHDYKSWKLDSVVDPHGNRVDITWRVFSRLDDTGRLHLKESYPTSIRYTTNTGAGDNYYEYEVRFELEAKDHDVKETKRFAESGYLLRKVGVYYRPASGGEILVRKYVLNYADSDWPHYYLLQSITQYADASESQALPATSFGYDDSTIGWKVDERPDESGGIVERTVDRWFLTSVNNGYGGILSLGYQAWCLSNSPVVEDPTCASGNWWLLLLRASSKQLSPGGGGTAMDSSYDYDEPGWERTEEGEVPVKAFIGYRWTTEVSGAGQRRATTEFYHTMYADGPGQPVIGHPNDLMKGKTLWSRTGKHSGTSWHEYGSTGWQEYSETDYDYQKVNYHATDASWPVWAYFIYANQVVERTCSSGSCQGTKTVYGYDPTWGDYCTPSGSRQQLGNLTHVREYDSESAATPYRTTLRGYCPNKTAWVVDKMAFDDLFAGDTTGTLKAATLYIYGPNLPPTWNQPPNTRGELQGVRRYGGPNQYVDTRYTYDLWGNVIQETTFNSYGTDSGWASANPRTTDTTYDTHHSLPTWVEGPLVGSYRPTTAYEYYEVNESDTSGAGLPGQVKRGWDVDNDDSTWSQYDVFGRLIKVAKPGDSLNDPTQQFAYYAGTNPSFNWGTGPQVMVGVSQKTEPNLPKLWTRKFYDGLGRLVQVQTPAEDWVDQGGGVFGGQDIVQFTTYDESGRVSKESLPYEMDSYDLGDSPPFSTPYRTPGSEAGTSYTYDALGRPVRTTNPDGTWNEHRYGLSGALWYDDVIDENRHLKGYLSDSFGRMVTVLEAVGTCGIWGYTCGEGETAWAVTGTTSYAYDVLDNLTAVTDDAGNPSTMGYNLLGRKTAMTDPDMGSWVYGYDPVGNLQTQTDAKNQTIGFVYDALNRLTMKDYASGSDVYYQYDDSQMGGAGINSWGRLRSVRVGNLGVNERLYEYDHRGRTTKEQVKIDSATYDTSYTYDAADRVKTMTYPGGEVVTTAYNMQNLPLTLQNNSGYVYVEHVTGDDHYTALGQPTLFTLGGTSLDLQIKYAYNGDDRRLYRLRVGTSGWWARWLYMEYAYDNAGNVSYISDRRDGVWQYQNFTYDHLDRLTRGYTSGDGTWGQYDESYSYKIGDEADIGNLRIKAGVTYTYGSSRPHAVSSTSAGGLFSYDANGNMTSRLLTSGGPTYTQVWDVENRLTSVAVSGGGTTYFTYDGNGTLVKKVAGGQTTVYVGPHYEKNVTTGQVTKYYFFGGNRIAMNQGGVVYYLAGDHLGTTSVTFRIDNNQVAEVAESRHRPYGVERWTSGTVPTDYRFTGQQFDGYIKLYHMGARWYDSELCRWISPDTLVPDPADPQALNRFTYVYGSPLRHTDPSGHCAPDDEECNALADQIESESEWHVIINRCQGGGDVQDCKFWTVQELGLLWATYQEHVWGEDLGQRFITFVRLQGDFEFAAAHWSIDSGVSRIGFTDDAYYISPSHGIAGVLQEILWGREDIFFQGVIAHELTHAALASHPDRVASFMNQEWPFPANVFTEPNILFGGFYDWSIYENRYGKGTEAYNRAEAEEMIAMMVQTIMYDPWVAK